MRTGLSFSKLLAVPISSSTQMAFCIPFRSLLRHKNRSNTQIDYLIEGKKGRDGSKRSDALSLVQTEGVEVLASAVNLRMMMCSDALSLIPHPGFDDGRKESDALSLCSHTLGLFAVSDIDNGETDIYEQHEPEQRRSLSQEEAQQSTRNRVITTPVTMPVDPRFPEMLMQPDSRPISEEQLSAEVKSIYAGLVMVESKSIRT
jgi:hypothetical protein